MLALCNLKPWWDAFLEFLGSVAAAPTVVEFFGGKDVVISKQEDKQEDIVSRGVDVALVVFCTILKKSGINNLCFCRCLAHFANVVLAKT